MGCGEMGCARCFLIFLNTIYFLTGGGLLGVAVWLRVDDMDGYDEHVSVLVPDKGVTLYIALYVLMAVGGLILTVSFCGCAGAATRSHCMLGFHLSLLVLIILLEIAGSVVLIIDRAKVDEIVSKSATETLKAQTYATVDANTLTYTPYGQAMNSYQQRNKCCGVKDSADYTGIAGMDTVFGTSGLPYACYPKVTGDPSKPSGVNDTACGGKCLPFPGGCGGHLEEWLDQNLVLIIAIAMTILFLQIYGLVIGSWACVVIRREQETEW